MPVAGAPGFLPPPVPPATELFDPDSEATAIISASLLTEAERLDG